MNTTAVTVLERAAVALGSSKAEAELLALAAKSQSITAITNTAGREECHAAAMVAKNARIAVEKTAKTAREDATLFSKAVIAEGSRLVALIEPEESRLIALRDEWDSAIAREKAARAEAERIALAQIRTRIDNIRAWPMLAATASPAAVLDDIARLEALEVDDSFGASYGEAVEAKAVSLAKLREIHDAKVAAEAEASRARDELAAQAERNRLERAEIEAQRAKQALIDAAAKAERDEERRQLEAARAEIAEARRLIAEANAAAEAKRIADAAAAQKVIDDAAAEAKRAADAIAAQELHELAQKQAAAQAAEYAEQQKAASVPAIAVAQPEPVAQILVQPMPVLSAKWLADLNVLTGEMTDNEGARLVHYARRLIAERQVAA
jgi:hypothetical protein